MPKYHKDVYWPDVQMPAGAMVLDYSYHALDRAEEYNIKLVSSIIWKYAEFIECEVENGKVTKVLVRVPYSKTHHLILVIMPAKRWVKTVWLNHINDYHSTLTTQYDRA